MHRSLFVLLSVLAISNAEAQTVFPDSLRRNEFGVNISPAVVVIAGGVPNETAFGISYRRYMRNQNVFRCRLSVFPFNERRYFNTGVPVYDHTAGNRNIFKTVYQWQGPKAQLALGYEKLYRFKKFVHGFGAELFLSYRTANYGEYYQWRLIGNQPNFVFGDTTNFSVDSLGFLRYESQVGLGLHFFYSLRYVINKRFLVSASLGPNISYLVRTGVQEDFATGRRSNYQTRSFDLIAFPMVTEFSFCFLF